MESKNLYPEDERCAIAMQKALPYYTRMDEFYRKNKEKIDGFLKVSDPLGRTVQEQPLQLMPGESRIPLQIEQPIAGLYYVQIISGGKKIVKEVVVF